MVPGELDRKSPLMSLEKKYRGDSVDSDSLYVEECWVKTQGEMLC